MSRAMRKLKATLASSLILQENGDLVTRPIQPDDVQRIVAHVAFSRAIRAHTLVFRPSSVSLLSHWVLWAAHFPFITQTRDVTSSPCLPSSAIECKAISAHCLRTSAEKKGMRMSTLMKGLKVSLPGATAGSFSNQKEKELVVWPALPLHIPPNRLFPQTLEEASASHCKTLLPPTTRPRPPKRFFHTLQGFVQCHIWIFEVLFPKCSSCLVSSQDVVFTRGVVVFRTFPDPTSGRIPHRTMAQLHFLRQPRVVSLFSTVYFNLLMFYLLSMYRVLNCSVDHVAR